MSYLPKHASKQASKQVTNQANKQTNKQANKQTNKQITNWHRWLLLPPPPPPPHLAADSESAPIWSPGIRAKRRSDLRQSSALPQAERLTLKPRRLAEADGSGRKRTGGEVSPSRGGGPLKGKAKRVPQKKGASKSGSRVLQGSPLYRPPKLWNPIVSRETTRKLKKWFNWGNLRDLRRRLLKDDSPLKQPFSAVIGQVLQKRSARKFQKSEGS